jgi:hypothetical protein
MVKENVMERQQNECLQLKLGKTMHYPLLPVLLLLLLLLVHDHQCPVSKDPIKDNLQASLPLRHPLALLHNKL